MLRSYKAVATLMLAVASVFCMAQQNEFVQGELLIKFRGTGATFQNNATVTSRAIGATIKKTIQPLNVVKVKLPTGMSVMDAVAYYRANFNVVYAEPNYKGKYHFIPNDTRFAQQYGPTIIKAPQAWDLTKGNPNVIIAILDSGFDLGHEDMVGKFTAGFDFEDNDTNPDWDGEVNHGIHVAGIAAAATNNAKGIAGSGFNCRIMPLRLGSVPTADVSAAALIFAADNGAKVASMSYGRGIESQVERDAINYAWSKGVVLLASSGNDGTQNQNFPGAFTNVIGVGATNAADQRTDFSTFGTWVDVGSPGAQIWSTVENNGYEAWDGTSMACPMAAGVVGLMWSVAGPGTTATQIRNALESTTDPISNGGFGNGRINALRACQAVDPGAATISPVSGVTHWVGASTAGAASDLQTSDGNFSATTSSASSVGQVAGTRVDVAFTTATSNLREAFAYIEANGASGTSGQLYLWNFNTGKYILIKAFALRPTGVKREKIILPKLLTPYVQAGTMRLGIRGIGPNRTPREWPNGTFDLQINFVEVATRENQSF